MNWNSRTSTVLLILFFLVFILIDFGFYVKEAVDCHVFVTLLATVLVSRMDRKVVSYFFPLATTAHVFLVIFVLVFTASALWGRSPTATGSPRPASCQIGRGGCPRNTDMRGEETGSPELSETRRDIGRREPEEPDSK
jgi:hypothetical protein